MNSLLRRISLLLVVVVYSYVIPAYLPQGKIRADIGCSVTISPSSIRGGATSTATFTVQRFEGSDEITSARIATTSVDEFQIQSAQASGWTSNVTSSNSVSFDGGTIAAGGSQAFSLSLVAIDQDQSTIAWEVYVNEDIVCTGSPGIAIYKSSSSTGATLYNTGTTGITTSEATISWTTSTASSSQIEYGTTSSYGSTKSSSTLSTNHSLTLTGLSAGTTYHFKVSSVDAENNQVSSSDYTFSTSGAGTTTTTTSTTVITPTSAPTPAPDQTKPMIILKTDLSKPVKVAPKIEGEASDNKGVALIDYSVDNGDNWIAVDEVSTKNSLRKTFSFTPPQDLDDGNYPIIVRATDTSGNRGLSRGLVMIIDRLKPQIGPRLYHIGSMLLEPQGNGDILIPADTTTSLIFSAIGGPTSIKLKVGDEIINAKKNKYTGLWESKFSLAKSGRYEIRVTATDGAENVTLQSLGFVTAQSKGVVKSDSSTKPMIAVYAKQPQVNEFVLWDGAPYGINNPITTDKDGRYSIILPAGTYYIQYSGVGLIKTNSTIFTITQPTIISTDVKLETVNGLRLGPFFLNFWDQWKTNNVSLTPEVEKTLRRPKSELLNKPFPSFLLRSGNEQISELSVRGEASVLTVLSSWSPFSQNQLLQLEKVKPELANTMVLYPQESEVSVTLNKKKGGYKSALISDKDGELSEKLDVQTVPTHYFINRQGLIKDVVVGVLTSEEIIDNLIY